MSDSAATPKNENEPQAVNENMPEPTKEPRSQDVMELDGMIDTLEDKLDKVTRAYADSENRAKRAEKDRSDALKYGVTKLARDLLEVSDNLERALKLVAPEQKEQFKDMFEGIELTQKVLIQTFERHDIHLVETNKFDPNLHEAVSQIPMPDKQSGDIIDVLRSGYKIGDRLLRPAQVIVCM